MTKNKRRTAARSLAKFSLILASLAIFTLMYLAMLARPVSRDPRQQEFEIVSGDSTVMIANKLKTEGLIRSPNLFRLIVKQMGLSGKLQAGYFYLSPSMTSREIASALTKGMTKSQKLTIPEGYRLEQIAETAGLPTKEFLTVAKGMEGKLFPDTYFLKEGITSQELVDLMHANFVKKVGEIDQKTLIIASLIERETRSKEEKGIVSGIIHKRLAQGWALELDATVQYFLGKSGNWWPNTTLLDRKLNSPYNTYTNQGLPPGPIGNPGLDAIEAARNPVDSSYWFYLHDRNGVIRYATTNDEHNKNIAKYIR